MLAELNVAAVRRRNQGQRGQRRRRESSRIKPAEQIWCHLFTQRGNLLGHEVPGERLAVHELQRPRTHVQNRHGASRCGASLHQSAQSHVREGTDDVGEHLDHAVTVNVVCIPSAKWTWFIPPIVPPPMPMPPTMLQNAT